MKVFICRSVLLIALLTLACGKRTNNSEWHKLSCGLYRSESGEIGFKTIENKDGTETERYLTSFCCDGLSLASVVDTSSFTALGNGFYKDRNNTYRHNLMADGGNLVIER